MFAPSSFAPLRWFQFTLRDLAWAVVVLACIFSWYVPRPAGIRSTGRELDLAIQGQGFFMVEQSNTGLMGYVRHGHFTLNNCGQLCFGRPIDGWIVQPQLTFPVDHQEIEIAQDGTVLYRQQNVGQSQAAGQLQLAMFVGVEHLHEVASNVFIETQHSGCANIVNPGFHGAGLIRQKALEFPPDERSFDAATCFYALVAAVAILAFRELRLIRIALIAQSSPPSVFENRFSQAGFERDVEQTKSQAEPTRRWNATHVNEPLNRS